ncbi:MAG: D-amino acid aminotransferase [Firmicutes bacterium]|nr:D-amino acid aminotransferase [Bacillota bacterium]
MDDMVVYLNGEFIPYSEAKIGIEDRGYQFGDGIYEVIRVYDGKPFALREHFERLTVSAREIELTLPDVSALERDALELLRRNDAKDCAIYIQISRGVTPRKHVIPFGLAPTVIMTAREAARYAPEVRFKGVKAITLPDDRWARCYIKSTNLLPNITAKLRAERAGAYEAVYLRDGFVTEGTHSNVFIAESGVLITPPLTNYILAGVTRTYVLDVARALGVPTREESISAERLAAAGEIMFTGTLTEIMPAVVLNGAPVGQGQPGPVFHRLYPKYLAVATGQESF